jgi:hypothetical protein
MAPDETAILTLLVNALLAADETFPPWVRIKALSIAIDTAMDVQLSFFSVLGVKLT